MVGLLVVGAMGSLPTAAQSGERIKAYYDAHRQVIIVQQLLGALLVVPFLGFVVALDRPARAGAGADLAGSAAPGCSSPPPRWRRTCPRSSSRCWPIRHRRRRTR